MIISHAAYQNIIALIHDIAVISSILIWCRDQKRDEEWTKQWYKIKDVTMDISSICNCLKQIAPYKPDGVPISFVPTNEDNMFDKSFCRLDPIFIYTQILKEILLTITFEQYQIKRFIDFCCSSFSDDDTRIATFKQIEENYHTRTPIWWYTSNSFLYQSLNHALREWM
ncbi:hypothetical protein I4U23_012597 [Adineta vaga]|nr:hypothetical protein I4U23_012597 [Adineta vaga]